MQNNNRIGCVYRAILHEKTNAKVKVRNENAQMHVRKSKHMESKKTLLECVPLLDLPHLHVCKHQQPFTASVYVCVCMCAARCMY